MAAAVKVGSVDMSGGVRKGRRGEERGGEGRGGGAVVVVEVDDDEGGGGGGSSVGDLHVVLLDTLVVITRA
jgi:hypothetical protein